MFTRAVVMPQYDYDACGIYAIKATRIHQNMFSKFDVDFCFCFSNSNQ